MEGMKESLPGGIPHRDELRKLPKVELHRHLEGSVRPETILDIGKRLGFPLPASSPSALRSALYIKKAGLFFKEVLGRFDLAQRCCAGPKEIERITFEAIEDAALDNVVLLELRFSPAYMSLGHELEWNTILDSILAGKEKASKEFQILVGIILISSRDLGTQACRKTIDLAIGRRESVVGVDLAGDEEGWPCEMFEKEFTRAKEAGLKITIHAGELGTTRDIRDAILKLHADRIGHGLKAIEDERLLDLLRERSVTLELCPTSNLMTRAVNSKEEYPLRKFVESGVKVTINTDDPEIFGISLSDEYEFSVKNLGLGMKELRETIQTALRASFLREEKAGVGKRLGEE